VTAIEVAVGHEVTVTRKIAEARDDSARVDPPLSTTERQGRGEDLLDRAVRTMNDITMASHGRL
jgi:hypothetical protein